MIPPGAIRAQAGLSLLECLVALSLGLSVVAAVLATEWSASRGLRLAAAQLQMAEDAQIGLQLLTHDLMNAGYARPTAVTPGAAGRGSWQSPLQAPAVWACDFGFQAPSTTGALTCAAAGPSAALMLRYQADEHNTVALSGSNRPSDCLGAGLSATEGAYLTESRWYVASSQGRSELRCASRLGNSGQPMVDNVELLALGFAEASVSDSAQPARWVRASQVADFSRVRGVRLCLLMRSTDPVLGPEDPADYVDCDGQRRRSADRRLRRAFFATVAGRSSGP